MGSTLMCRICKEPPRCIALCHAKIFYVHSNDTTQRACIHLANHCHPINVSNYRYCRTCIKALIEEHIERTPPADPSKIILEVSKGLVGEFQLRNDSDPHQLLSLGELEPVFLSLQRVEFLHKISCFTFSYHCRGLLSISARGSTTPSFWS